MAFLSALDLIAPGVTDTGKIGKMALIVGGVALGALLLSGKGSDIGESFSKGLTGVGGGVGGFLGNIGEGIGGFGTGFGTGFSAITASIGGAGRGVFDFGKSLVGFSSLHQRNMQTTFNMRTMQLLREGGMQ